MQGFKRISIQEAGDAQWANWLNQIEESHLMHTSGMLRYFNAFKEDSLEDLSFAIIDSSAQLLAVCPFGLSNVSLDGKEFVEASFSGAPLGHPAMRWTAPNERRRIARDVFQIIDEICRAHFVSRIVLRKPAIDRRSARDPRPIYMLDAVDNGYLAFPRPILVMDLRKSEEDLFNVLTTEHRKRIRQSIKKGVTVKTYIAQASAVQANSDAFRGMQEAHFQSAGKKTRPDRTWDLMLELLQTGKATLFVAYIKNTPISYLYCGEYDKYAVGWSQVNLEAFERDYSPRHVLEWHAIAHYRSLGIHFYEIGERFRYPSLLHVPSAKETTISLFKERYGAEPWPDYIFEKYYDKELQQRVLLSRYQNLLAAQQQVIPEVTSS